MEININTATILAGIFIANIASIFGAYISIIVKLTRLEVKADGFEKDLNNAWNYLKTNNKKEE